MVREHAANYCNNCMSESRIRKEIRRMRKRTTWANPTGWEMNKGKFIVFTVGMYLLALIALLKGGIRPAIGLLSVAIVFTIIYIRTERQLRNRFKHIEEKFRSKVKDK
jgi:hypothetical protein